MLSYGIQAQNSTYCMILFIWNQEEAIGNDNDGNKWFPL